MDKKKPARHLFNHFEAYIAAGLFIIIGLLLTIQVFTRYVLNHSLTWAEELATLLFVPMIYSGISAAVIDRKHVAIEAVQQFVPFKIRKMLKIVSEGIFCFFCIYIQFPFYNVIANLGNSVTDLLRFPKKNIYIWIPIFLTLTAIRCIQDIFRLFREDEESLGKSKPTIDLDACEREYLATLGTQESIKEGE